MAAIETLSTLIERHKLRTAVAARLLYKQAVRPVYFSRTGRRVELLGSAVIAEFGGASYLITAAHVLDARDHASLHLGGQPEILPLALGFRSTQKVGDDRSSDHVDIAVARLPPEVAAKIDHLGRVRSEHISNQPGIGAGRTLIAMGYRASQNKTGHIASGMLPLKIWTCVTGLAAIPNATDRQGRGQHNFGLDYPKKMLRSGGEPVVTTPPHGVSGGAIFDLGDFTNLEHIAAASPPPPRLVGIVIECRDHVLIGTKMAAVRDAVEAQQV